MKLYRIVILIYFIWDVLALFNIKLTKNQYLKRGSISINMQSLAESQSTIFYKTLEQKLLNLDQFQIVNIPDIYQYNSAQLMKSNVEFSCKAYKGSHWIRYLRIIKFIGEKYDILNIMAVPFANNSLPILGIDTVALPGLICFDYFINSFICLFVLILYIL
jgi:hypothetical protein